jgi:hypothetical protein
VKKRFVITLDEAVTARYLAEAARKTQAEVDTDCIPSGASLRIDLSPPFGDFLSMLIGNEWVQIGEVGVELKTVE